MLSEKTVSRILDLLAAGRTYSQIQAAVGVSRSTIQLVKFDRWAPGHSKKRPARITPPDRQRQPVHCPVCEAWVYPPCLACQLRAMKGARR